MEQQQCGGLGQSPVFALLLDGADAAPAAPADRADFDALRTRAGQGAAD